MLKGVNKKTIKEFHSSNPLISVIVPVYNAERYIEKCIHSIVNQTFLSWELILVDDGSLDNSGVICDNLSRSDARIKVIHKKNGGVSSARNIGIDCTKGSWITFVDSDDWVSENYLEAFVSRLEDEDDVLYLQGIQMFTIHRGLATMFRYGNECYSIKDQLGNFVKNRILSNGCPVAKLFNARIIKDNALRFDETISINEDHLFVLSYYNYVDKICTISSMSYYYYYDFTVPSLTKINHSYDELHRVSLLMHKVYNSICSKFSFADCEKEILEMLFGPNQAVMAIISCLFDKESFSVFHLCDEFLCKNFGYETKRYDVEYRPYVKLLSLKVNIKVKFWGAKFIYACYSVRNRIKYRLKILLWHSRIKQNKL